MKAKTTKCISKYLIFLQISSLTSMKKLKNSLELLNPTRNTRKFANKLMTDISGGINYLSRSESETCGWRNTFFSVHNIPFESNASIKPEKCLTYTVKKK